MLAITLPFFLYLAKALTKKKLEKINKVSTEYQNWIDIVQKHKIIDPLQNQHHIIKNMPMYTPRKIKLTKLKTNKNPYSLFIPTS